MGAGAASQDRGGQEMQHTPAPCVRRSPKSCAGAGRRLPPLPPLPLSAPAGARHLGNKRVKEGAKQF